MAKPLEKLLLQHLHASSMWNGRVTWMTEAQHLPISFYLAQPLSHGA